MADHEKPVTTASRTELLALVVAIQQSAKDFNWHQVSILLAELAAKLGAK